MTGTSVDGRAPGAAPRRAEPEAPLLRRTRWRLIAWSGGSTLVVLLVLGVAIYAAAASSLASAGVAQLEERVAQLSVAPGPVFNGQAGGAGVGLTVVTDAAQPGVMIGGPASGTLALVVPQDILSFQPGPTTTMGGTVSAPAGGAGPAVGGIPLVSDAVLAAVRGGGRVVVETELGGAPVRVLGQPITASGGDLVAVVIGDRTSELDTLRTLLVVLLVGGLAVLAASIAVGYVYAGRALVPIRESLLRQREFAADASHELRTPLAITRAAIAELRRGRDDPLVVDRALDDMDAGTQRLERLVDDLLLLARTDADAITLVETDTDLALASAEATEALEPVAAARSIRLALDLEPAPVRGDEARLRQLAAILVDNAIRHSPDGGRVSVAVRGGATLIVEDEGPGIAPEDLEHVFERFWRAPGAPAGGTGLGLSIARWIVERHGGTIVAGNRAGADGARFTVHVPAS